MREKSLDVIRMARDLAELDPLPESQYGHLFEEPSFLTLGACYEQEGRFAGSAYQPVLKRVESFLDVELPAAIETREGRAQALFELAVDRGDIAVAVAVQIQGLVGTTRREPVRCHQLPPGVLVDDLHPTNSPTARSPSASRCARHQTASAAGRPQVVGTARGQRHRRSPPARRRSPRAGRSAGRSASGAA
ncbi:MAG: hypothetical protein AAF628_20485 [Planctomycetota bacterium]